MEFEWDDAKSEQNVLLRALPFDVAVILCEGDMPRGRMSGGITAKFVGKRSVLWAA